MPKFKPLSAAYEADSIPIYHLALCHIKIKPSSLPDKIFEFSLTCKFFYEGWANARDAEALWKSVLNHRATRVVDNPEEVKTIRRADVVKAFDQMILDRKPKMSQKEHHQQTLQDLLQSVTEPEPRTEVHITLN